MAYDVKVVKAPRLTGVPLAAVASILENPLSGALLAPKLLADVGITDFRKLFLDEVPSVLPDLPRPSTLAEAPPATAVDAFALVEGAARPGGHPYETVADYARAYREQRTTPLEVANKLIAALRAGAAMSPPTATMIAWKEEDIRAQAEASARRWTEGKPRSPLDGVPIAVKDELDLAGYPTTVGTKFLGAVAAEDAAAAGRLRAAGAVLYGKANMIEIGIDTMGFNAHYGTPRNPFGASPRYPGGSSSGSGAAVGLGLGPIAVGADGGGSIRIPAALCGVVGLKATHGRISEKGAFPLCWSVGHAGPIGATVRDVALAYQIMAGPVEGDDLSRRQPPVTLAGLGEGVAGLRIGVYREWFEHADPAIVRACRALVDGLVAAGAVAVEVDIPDLEMCRVAQAITILCEMGTTMDRYASQLSEQGLAVRINLAMGRYLTGRDFVRAQQARTRMTRNFARVFERCDVIATPTTAITAPPLRPDVTPRGESNLEVVTQLMRFVSPLNLTGHPALTVPAGYDGEGLPIGLQLIGRPWEEHVLLRAGEATEKLVARRKPELSFRLLEEKR